MSVKKQKAMQELWDSSVFAGGNSAYLEEMFESYLQDNSSVPKSWQSFFKDLSSGLDNISHVDIIEQMKLLAQSNFKAVSSTNVNDKQANVLALIDAYRNYGHSLAKLDPHSI